MFKITYQEAWDFQTALQKKLIANKLEWRNLSGDEKESKKQLHHLLLCEHNHVYTLGKSGSMDNLLIDDEQMEKDQIEFFKINRGGDITYHGPGQITGYPIFDLDEFFTDIHKYVRLIEEVIIQTMADYGLEGIRLKEHTGVWLKPDLKSKKYRKICAIGVHLSRWVTMHGFAFNVNSDLNYFNHIIPCGINEEDKTVTSLQHELGKSLDMAEVRSKLKEKFSVLFEYDYTL